MITLNISTNDNSFTNDTQLNILELPTEIQEIILSYVDIYTSIESVCFFWNILCRKTFLKRFRCNCDKNVKLYNNKIITQQNLIDKILECKTSSHKCICYNLPKTHINICKSTLHQCICLRKEIRLSRLKRVCKSNSHNCICRERSQSYCQSDSHKCVCVIGWEKTKNKQSYYDGDLCIRRKKNKDITTMYFYCRASEDNHLCSCDKYPEACISKNCLDN